MMREQHASVGMIEFTSIAAGMEAADRMVKAAGVEVLFFKTVCPGKFLAAVTGNVAAVAASVEAGRDTAPHTIVDWFLIPNIHCEVIAALSGAVPPVDSESLGIIETFSAASIIVAADAAVKAAAVRVMDIRIALGLGGKGYALFCGEVAAVQAAVEAGAQRASESGLLAGKVVIPRPAESFFESLL